MLELQNSFPSWRARASAGTWLICRATWAMSMHWPGWMASRMWRATIGLSGLSQPLFMSLALCCPWPQGLAFLTRHLLFHQLEKLGLLGWASWMAAGPLGQPAGCWECVYACTSARMCVCVCARACLCTGWEGCLGTWNPEASHPPCAWELQSAGLWPWFPWQWATFFYSLSLSGPADRHRVEGFG